LCSDGTVYSWGIGESGELGRRVATMKRGEKYDIEAIVRYGSTYDRRETALAGLSSFNLD
jgi:alpha-tubulin suppressor-like RCC1 family protein